jgi:hypothetical protein
VDDDLGIASTDELMARIDESGPELRMVPDLAVEHRPYGVPLVTHGLMSASGIYDAQSTMTENGGP